MRDEIAFEEAGLFLVPVVECPHRDLALQEHPGLGGAATARLFLPADRRKQSLGGRNAHRQH